MSALPNPQSNESTSKRKRVEPLSNEVNTEAAEIYQKAHSEFNAKMQKAQEEANKKVKNAQEEANKKVKNAVEDVNSKILELETSQLEAEKAAWEEQKIMIGNTQKLDSTINLNVGRMRFSTTLATLNTFPYSMLGAMFSGRHTITKTDGEYFINRSGRLFCYILEFLLDAEHFEIDLSGVALKDLKKEALYFGLDDVMFPTPPPPVPVAPFKLDNVMDFT